jgi:translation elongation factor EF-4
MLMVQKDLQYKGRQATLIYRIPLSEVVLDFFDSFSVNWQSNMLFNFSRDSNRSYLFIINDEKYKLRNNKK